MIAAMKFRSSGMARFAVSSALSSRFRLGALALAALAAGGAAQAQTQDWPGDDSYAPQAGGMPAAGAPQTGYAQQPLNATDLSQLVAPIALYPDTLIAQILAASTYPAQVSAASQFVQSMGNVPAEQLAAAVNGQTGWDPSVKALAAFPQVLDWMAQNLQWTSALGNAYYNQPQDVMQSIQMMRQRAQDSGSLESTPQQQVYEDQGAINIAPADPDVVYVPTYDPWLVYGDPIAPYPGFVYYGPTWGGYFGFGPGIYMNAWFGWGWGWRGWGLDWWHCSVRYHDNFYRTHSGYVHDWGLAHGGPRWNGGDFNRGGGWNRGDVAGGRGNYGGGFQAHGGPQSGAVRGRDLGMGQGGAQGFNRGQGPQSGALRQGIAGSQQAGRPSYNGGGQPGAGYVNRGGAMGFASPSSPAPRVGGMQNSMRAPMNGGYRSFGGNGYAAAPRSTYSSPSQPRSFSYGGGQSYGGRSYAAPQSSRSYGGQSYGGGRPSSGGSAPRSFSSGGGGGHSFSGGGGGHAPSGGGGGHHR